MTISNKPATALPWLKHKWRVHFSIISTLAIVADVRFAGDSTRGTTTEKDVDYIVHSANAYPKLVEALQKYLRTAVSATMGDLADIDAQARALLTELGETL